MKTRVISGIFACLLILGAGLSGTAVAGDAKGGYKFGGAWIAKVDGLAGQWTYVISPDPSGRTASGVGSIDAGFYLGPAFETDKSSPILIQARMTGPNTGAVHSIWYGLKELAPPSVITYEIVYIGVVDSAIEFVGPGKIEALHDFAIYMAAQDIDGDGLPDEGQTPVYTFQVTTTDTRVPSP